MLSSDLARQLRRIRSRIGQAEAKAGPLYLEGAYAPTYLGGTTAGVTTYSLQTAVWTRIGNMITVRGQVVWTAATGTGNAQVSLPVAPNSGNFAGSLYLSGVTFANSAPELLVSGGNTFFTMGSPLTNAGPTVVAIEAAGNITFTVSYFVA